MYVSEFTHFLDDLKEKNPDIVGEQKKGRALWWDKKPATQDEVDRLSEARVRQHGYVYQTKL